LKTKKDVASQKRYSFNAQQPFNGFYMRMGALVSMASMPAPSCAYSMASDKVGTVPPDGWVRLGTRRDIDLKIKKSHRFNFILMGQAGNL
jgi:hypothetical protein